MNASNVLHSVMSSQKEDPGMGKFWNLILQSQAWHLATSDTMQVVQVMIKETDLFLLERLMSIYQRRWYFFCLTSPTFFFKFKIWDLRDNICRSGVGLPWNDLEQWFWTVKWESRQASKRHLEHLWENLGQSVHNTLMKKTGFTTQKQDFSRNIMTVPHLQQNWSNHYSFSCHVLDCQEGRASCIHQNRLVEAKAYIFNPSSGSLCLRERWRDSWIKEHVDIYIYIFNTVTWADLLNSGAQIRFIWKIRGLLKFRWIFLRESMCFVGHFSRFLKLMMLLLWRSRIAWTTLVERLEGRVLGRFQPQGFLKLEDLHLTLRC